MNQYCHHFLFVMLLLFYTEVQAKDVDTLAWVNMDSLLMPVDTLRNENSITTYEAPEIKFPEVTPKSPEASAFMKYGGNDINEYTGNPAISVPLYTISYKGVDIPINLSYDGDGVQVAQEASWVGLGWNLNVGGCINYVSQGGNDQWLGRHGSWENDYYRILNSNPAPHFKMNSNFAQVAFVSSTQSDNIHDMLQDLRNGQAEWDFYSVNVLGHSFLFFKNPYTNSFEILGSWNETFQINELANNDWEIIDVNGIRYTFSEKEYAKESSWGGFVSAWYLTQISLPSGGSVYFNYSGEYSYTTLPKYAQIYDYVKNYKILQATNVAGYPDNAGIHSFVSSGVWGIDKKYLSSVETDDETIKVDFKFSSRKDLKGAQKLDLLSVTSPISGATIKTFKLNYSYFDSCLKGGNYLAFPQKDNYSQEDLDGWDDCMKYRLKLLSVKELDKTLSDSLTTSFEYYETAGRYGVGGLPLKTSCAIDFWGYYNGQENKNAYKGYVSDLGLANGLLPKPSDCFIGHQEALDGEILELGGANRFSDGEYMKIGTLHKIVYPTKGYTVYDFEPHTFYSKVVLPASSSKDVTGTTYSVADINFVADGSHPGTGPDVYKRFKVLEDSWGELKITVQGRNESEFHKMASEGACVNLIQIGEKPVARKFNMISLQIDYPKLRFETTIHNLDIPKGEYVFSADLPASMGNWDFQSGPNYIGGNLTVKSKRPLSSDSTQTAESSSIGAGLRIGSISNYSSDGTLMNRVCYEYQFEDGKTSGKSLIPFNVVQNKSYLWATKESLSSYDVARFSCDLIGNSSFTSSVSKGKVGYSCVNRKVYDGNNNLVRTVVSTYKNEVANAIFNDYYQFADFTNGSMLTKNIYSPQGKLLSSEDYSYQRETGRMYKCNSFLERLVYGNVDAYRMGYFQYGNLYQLTVYSYFSSWNSLVKLVTKNYGENGEIIKSQTYEYNKNNHLVSSEIVCDNDGVRYETKYQYPCDIDDGLAGMMASRHYLSPVLYQRIYKNGQISSTKQVEFTYKLTNYSLYPLLLPMKEKYALGSVEPEVRMEYEYDVLGNIQSAIKDKTEKVTYLWSYDNAYPILEIQGASYDEVVNWLGSSAVTELRRKKSPTYLDVMGMINNLKSHTVVCKGFLYNPGIGVTQIVDSNGYSTYYNYDSFNRLRSICDHEGNIVQEYTYKYKK